MLPATFKRPDIKAFTHKQQFHLTTVSNIAKCLGELWWKNNWVKRVDIVTQVQFPRNFQMEIMWTTHPSTNLLARLLAFDLTSLHSEFTSVMSDHRKHTLMNCWIKNLTYLSLSNKFLASSLSGGKGIQSVKTCSCSPIGNVAWSGVNLNTKKHKCAWVSVCVRTSNYHWRNRFIKQTSPSVPAYELVMFCIWHACHA